MKDVKKLSRGITLISLVITIIVLLILAGVALTMLSGENGILTRAKTARGQHEAAQELEENRIAGMENEIRKYLGNTTSGSTTGGSGSGSGTGGSGSGGTTPTLQTVTYTVIFNSNGGTGNMQSQDFIVGNAQNLSTNSFEKNGFEFLGWNTDQNATTATYTNGVVINNENSLSETNGAVVNLYAIWNIESYTITYEGLEGATLTTENPTSYTIETEDFTLNNPTKIGYIFQGWTGTDLASATKIVTIDTGSIGDRSYTATWIVDPIRYASGKTFDTIAAGEIITFNGEEFKVISKTTTQIKAMPKYNITLTSSPVQSASAGTCAFSSYNYWGKTDAIDMTTSRNNIQRYITAYSNKLHNIDSRVTARVATHNELNASGITNAMRNPGNTGTFWLGSSYDSDNVYYVANNGNSNVVYQSYQSSNGIRPIVLFSKT